MSSLLIKKDLVNNELALSACLLISWLVGRSVSRVSGQSVGRSVGRSVGLLILCSYPITGMMFFLLVYGRIL